ncbi:hypothetical protein AMAG_04845 [Allomyces macrogynus ATCC 38327]|uniref:G-protein coupled receptors family 1 profile domain-containing protein n=1 Tax=Allomyces macrogynus (strain ATCC 38327) TaxID=578462 RepID=A0A0L0S637_ALLM3|nr:hypothetical protein AMAG_04845 [Allomyces macrogynus ATCC 38327]|eukprot:KNE58018.1 hypothetical protein AMAG_04845 [Allomyces macrogynus ATCC 38327]
MAAPGIDALAALNQLCPSICAPASFLVGSNTLNCVLVSYRARPIQRAIVASAVVSLLCDAIMLGFGISMATGSPGTTGLVLSLAVLKRVHSTVTAHMTFLRTTAMLGAKGMAIRGYASYYTAVYVLMSTISIGCLLAAQAIGGFGSWRVFTLPLFQYGYRITNTMCVLWYAIPAVFTDLQFAVGAGANAIMLKRFAAIAQYYNARIFFGYELALLTITIVTLLMDMANPGIMAASFTEQVLLSFISLNATYSIRAASSTSDTTSGGGSGSVSGAVGTTTAGAVGTATTGGSATSGVGRRASGTVVAGSMTGLVAKTGDTRRASVPAVKVTLGSVPRLGVDVKESQRTLHDKTLQDKLHDKPSS